MMQHLDQEYDYMIKNVDPIISEALEVLMYHKPEQVAAYLVQFMKNPAGSNKATFQTTVIMIISICLSICIHYLLRCSIAVARTQVL
jgi:hypothetical protein